MTALPKPAYVMSEPHLSGWRVVLGYETLADAQAAQSAVSAPEAREGEAVAGAALAKAMWGIDLVPAAPSADKLRIGLDEIERLVNQSGAIPKGELRSILAALKAEGC